mmetsp:Transcript_25139/g.63757  ORF Transcript_25139/g.63757 Transcript_25139/m.63757 type:complete len:208 (-) Transcript_25139:755-1378(-)
MPWRAARRARCRSHRRRRPDLRRPRRPRLRPCLRRRPRRRSSTRALRSTGSGAPRSPTSCSASREVSRTRMRSPRLGSAWFCCCTRTSSRGLTPRLARQAPRRCSACIRQRRSSSGGRRWPARRSPTYRQQPACRSASSRGAGAGSTSSSGASRRRRTRRAPLRSTRCGARDTSRRTATRTSGRCSPRCRRCRTTSSLSRRRLRSRT